MKVSDATRAKPFLDRVDTLVERLGMPGGVGRLLGWMLIGEPLCQTPEELAQATGLTQEALQAQLDWLVASETVERVAMPGKAAPCYTLRSPQELIERRSRQMNDLTDMVDEALQLVGDQSPEVRERLEAFRTLYVRLGEDMRELLTTPARHTPKAR